MKSMLSILEKDYGSVDDSPAANRTPGFKKVI